MEWYSAEYHVDKGVVVGVKFYLIQLVRDHKDIDVISRVLKKPEGTIYMKLKRLGLEVVVSEKNQLTTTTDFRPSGELPSIENVMQTLGVKFYPTKPNLCDGRARSLSLRRIDNLKYFKYFTNI